MKMDIVSTGHKRIAFTPYAYVFSYRTDGPDGQVYESTGEAAADSPLSELDLQTEVLSHLSGQTGVPAKDMVITRFHYMSLEPMSVGVVSLIKQDTDRTA